MDIANLAFQHSPGYWEGSPHALQYLSDRSPGDSDIVDPTTVVLRTRSQDETSQLQTATSKWLWHEWHDTDMSKMKRGQIIGSTGTRAVNQHKETGKKTKTVGGVGEQNRKRGEWERDAEEKKDANENKIEIKNALTFTTNIIVFGIKTQTWSQY